MKHEQIHLIKNEAASSNDYDEDYNICDDIIYSNINKHNNNKNSEKLNDYRATFGPTPQLFTWPHMAILVYKPTHQSDRCDCVSNLRVFQWETN